MNSKTNASSQFTEFSKHLTLDYSGHLEPLLEELKRISLASNIQRKLKNKIITNITLSLIFFLSGTTIIRILSKFLGMQQITDQYNFENFTRNIAILFFILAAYRLIKYWRRIATQVEPKIISSIISMLKFCNEKYQIKHPLEVTIDLRNYIEKKFKEHKDDHYIYRHYEDNWFIASTTLDNQEKLRWEITDSLTWSDQLSIRNVEGARERVEYFTTYKASLNGTESKEENSPQSMLAIDYHRVLNAESFSDFIKNNLSHK